LFSVLDDNLWPVIARHFSNRLWIFQQDNAPCHVSVRANQWKEENNINTLHHKITLAFKKSNYYQ
jgi:hypothetical protein